MAFNQCSCQRSPMKMKKKVNKSNLLITFILQALRLCILIEEVGVSKTINISKLFKKPKLQAWEVVSRSQSTTSKRIQIKMNDDMR